MNKKKYQQLLAMAILGSLLSIDYVAKAEEKIWMLPEWNKKKMHLWKLL